MNNTILIQLLSLGVGTCIVWCFWCRFFKNFDSKNPISLSEMMAVNGLILFFTILPILTLFK